MARGNSDDLASLLHLRIKEGEWGPDERMPTERTLADELGVARNTIRKALDQLEEAGVVVRHVGRGTYVKTDQSRTDLHRIVEKMKQSSPADMMELRMLIEPEAASLAAMNAGAGELAKIRKVHELAIAAADMPSFEHWDAELHRLIFECTRNDLLYQVHEILGVLRLQPLWFEMKQRSFSEARKATYCAQHEELVVSIEKRLGEEAREAMRAHLVSVRKNMLGR